MLVLLEPFFLVAVLRRLIPVVLGTALVLRSLSSQSKVCRVFLSAQLSIRPVLA